MIEWVKFKRSITQGAKRSLPRAVRFVYLELALAAGDLQGDIEIVCEGSVVDAIHDVIGGDKKEIARAWPVLSTSDDADDEPMVKLIEKGKRRFVRVVTWGKHNRFDKSTERVREHRRLLKEKASAGAPTGPPSDDDAGNGNETRFTGVSERDGNGPETPSERDGNGHETYPRAHAGAGARAGARSPSPSSPSGEGEGGGEEPLDEADPVIAALLVGRDLYPDGSLPNVEVRRAAERIARSVGEDPHARRDGVSASIATKEAVVYARAWGREHPQASPARLLSQVEQKVEWILGECRRGDRRQRPPPRGGRGGPLEQPIDPKREEEDRFRLTGGVK